MQKNVFDDLLETQKLEQRQLRKAYSDAHLPVKECKDQINKVIEKFEANLKVKNSL